MSSNAYELLASAMRYVFAALMMLIVLRAARNTLIDRSRAARLRHLSPETGIIGEVLITAGDSRVRTGDSYPLTLEGTIGSSAGADIRLRSGSVKYRHAVYQMTEKGLFVRGHANARVVDAHGRPAREITLHDGECFGVGRVKMLLILSDADSTPDELERKIRRRREDRSVRPEPRERIPVRDETGDSLFDTDSMFDSNPVSGFDPFEVTPDVRPRVYRDPFADSIIEDRVGEAEPSADADDIPDYGTADIRSRIRRPVRDPERRRDH